VSRIALVFAGGTISSVYDPAAGGNVPTLGAAEIIARAPGLDQLADLVPIDLPRVPASHLTPTRLLEIAATLRDLQADPSIDGVILAQGTDTIEETSFAWDLVLDDPTPVVVTGAMRSASEAGYDGPANLRDAVLAASAPALRGQGVVVVLGGTIEAADDVAKTHASSLTTFRSPNAGSLGRLDRERVVLFRRRAARRHVTTDRAAGRVHLITAVIGMDGGLLDAAVASGADGIVVAATGSGNTSGELLEAAKRAMAAGISVVLATRCLGGCVSPGYAFPGGGRTWFDAGAIPAGHLSGPKARLALAFGLGAGLAHDGLVGLLADPA
jgi:L-asparaginase